MQFSFCPKRPACPLTWWLAAALSVAAVTSGSSAAAADKPDTPLSANANRPAASASSTKSIKTAKPSPTSRPVKAATPRQALKSAATNLALASATAEAINEAQLAIAARVLTGDAECEFNQRITVLPEPDLPGYFRVSHKNLRFRMLPRETSTGAVRLEDPVAGIVWLQIPTKSMLMNTRIGQRLVDACTHPEQRLALAAVADTANGLGILPTAAAAATVPASAPVMASAPVPASAVASTADLPKPPTELTASEASAAAAAKAAAEAAAVTLAAPPLTAPLPMPPAPQAPQAPPTPTPQVLPEPIEPPGPSGPPVPPAPQVPQVPEASSGAPSKPPADGRTPG